MCEHLEISLHIFLTLPVLPDGKAHLEISMQMFQMLVHVKYEINLSVMLYWTVVLKGSTFCCGQFSSCLILSAMSQNLSLGVDLKRLDHRWSVAKEDC